MPRRRVCDTATALIGSGSSDNVTRKEGLSVDSTAQYAPQLEENVAQ